MGLLKRNSDSCTAYWEWVISTIRRVVSSYSWRIAWALSRFSLACERIHNGTFVQNVHNSKLVPWQEDYMLSREHRSKPVRCNGWKNVWYECKDALVWVYIPISCTLCTNVPFFHSVHFNYSSPDSTMNQNRYSERVNENETHVSFN